MVSETPSKISAASSIVDALAHGLAIIDREFRLHRRNDMYSEFSRSRDGDFCYQVFADRAEACENCPAIRTFRTGTISTAAVALATGKYHVVSYPLRDAAGEVSAAMMIVRDITLAAKMEGLIPICSSCRKIRDHEGAWERFESYFVKNLDMRFTHSICPECEQYLYPEATEDFLHPFAKMKNARIQMVKDREEMQQAPLDDRRFQKFMASSEAFVKFSDEWWAKIRKTEPI